jgi:signal recognition particle receptor subunit beta
VAEDRLNLVVLGEFKRGKSTLINALLDRDVLPTGVIPVTSVVTTIRAGARNAIWISFQDGRQEELSLAELADYVTEEGNPRNRRGVELACVELDDDLLRGGLELVDTPGIGSIHAHNTEVARGFLPRVDAALCVLDAGQPLSDAERDLLREAADRVPRPLVVINKIDHLDPADADVAVQFVRAALRDLLGELDAELFAVSARRRRGLVPLLARVRELAGGERRTLLLRSVAQLARSTAMETAQAARFESRAIETPLDQLGSRVVMFERRIAELESASSEAGDLLERGIDRALAELVNEPLERYAQREQARLSAELREHLDHVGNTPARELSTQLEGWIETTIRAEFERLVPRFETAIAERLTELERHYAHRIERILVEIQRAAEDVFGTRAGDVLPDTGLRGPVRFSFKLRDVEHALDIIVGFGRTVAPGSLGRRLVIRDAGQRLIEMTDRHAGRLRSELVSRVTDAVHEYRRELVIAVDEAVEAIRAAIERAGTDRRRGQEYARARLDELARIQRRSEDLAAEFEPWIEAKQTTIARGES